MPTRVVLAMFFCGTAGASLMYNGGDIRSVLFCDRDMFMAMHSLLGPFVKLLFFFCLVPRRFAMISSP